jgi:hypothetical protein
MACDTTPCNPLKNSTDVSEEHGTPTVNVEEYAKQETSSEVCFILVSSLAYSSTLKMEATCFSKTLVDFRQDYTALIPEDRRL